MRTPEERPRQPRTHGGVRQGNVQRVLQTLRANGPTSQAEIARLVRLSPTTVNVIVRELREAGLAEVRPVNGRESVVSLVSNVRAVVSVKVDLDAVHACLFAFGAEWRYDEHELLDSDDDSGGGDPATVERVVRRLLDRSGTTIEEVAGIGLGIAGPIERATGAVGSWARSRLPGWRGVAIEADLSARFGIPVIADNDANLAALGEWTWGAGRGSSVFVYVMCTSGIGGGIVLDGRVFSGADGLAGELGHLALDGSGPVCFCGSRGCLTQYASEHSILAALAASSETIASLRDVIDAARRGDPACSRVLFEAGRHLGRALANTAKLLSPDVIAIGGELGAAGSLVFDSLRSSVEISSLRVVSPGIRFRAAQILGDETLFGGLAAVLASHGHGISELPAWSLPKHP